MKVVDRDRITTAERIQIEGLVQLVRALSAPCDCEVRHTRNEDCRSAPLDRWWVALIVGAAS